MTMLNAYRKAAKLAERLDTSAIVVIVDNHGLPRSECYDAVTLEDWQEDGHCGQFFDFVAEVTR